MVETLSGVDFEVGKSFAGSNRGVGIAMKKVRRRTNVPPDLNDLTVDENGQAVWDTNALKVSYKTKLLGTPSDQNAYANMKEMFELQDGDVATKVIDGVISLIFSNQVHQLIEQKMALTVVVKVLGKKVGFNALLNKVSVFWSLRNIFKLIYLENDFYLVRFQDKDDFDNMLMGGPWVIFGHYLTVRSWSSDFSTANDNLDKQVVRIRLLELSEGYYSEFLLRAIG
ncbi:hypothetical protein J1N35_015505 [Gossypium stocksii]|uniref:DUF4283 domain-containing protein n=1 Tax=Gossypium stocksii TaxID=47602 RepID=A0A9D4AAE6_9ROSI|nr:hypothetical protein J1N35_015505 [Gossypium stocksii]